MSTSSNLMAYEFISKKAQAYFKACISQKVIKPEIDRNLNDTQRARYGFYFLVLEILTGVSDFHELDKMILDTEYLQEIHNIVNDDLGIDAAYVDPDQQVVKLFNFKYRGKYHDGSQISDNVITAATKFLSKLQGEGEAHSDKSSDPTNTIIANIRKQYDNSHQDWETQLYLVSNEDRGLSQSAFSRNEMIAEQYNFDLHDFVLPNLVDALFERPGTKKFETHASLSVKREEMMRFISNKDDKPSYLVKLTMADILRIFSRDAENRDNYKIEDYSTFKEAQLDPNFLFENVRGFLTKSNYNKGIRNTITNDPEDFFYYNNGLTIVCSNIENKPTSGGKVSVLTIKNYQVVNGGQTVRTMFDTNQMDFSEERLNTVEVLARIFYVTEAGIRGKIAEYTNSQNAISPVDLKSTDTIQLLIEHTLQEHDIVYVRKVGDLQNAVNGKRAMPLEILGQILYSVSGYPNKATNQKKTIFTREYQNLFPSDNKDFLNNVVTYSQEYFKNEDSFEDCTKQENFYILYMLHRDDLAITAEDALALLHTVEEEYKKDMPISPKRKLIQNGFKDELDRRLLKDYSKNKLS